jgi:hypothetical protein
MGFCLAKGPLEKKKRSTLPKYLIMSWQRAELRINAVRSGRMSLVRESASLRLNRS